MKYNTRNTLSLLVLAFSVALASDALAKQPIFTQTFDDIEPGPCDGLELDGVTYNAFPTGDPDRDCNAGVETPTTNNIQSPGIQSDGDRVLNLTFDSPTTVFGFGVAQLDSATNLQSVVVELYRPGKGMLRQVVFLDTSIDPEFSGARYDYTGPAVKSVTIKTNDAFSFPRIAIDNITYSYNDKGDKDKKGTINCPIEDIISSYEWPDVPNVEDSSAFCGADADNNDASFGVDALGDGLSYLSFESLDDAQWIISANILDEEAKACSVLVNCISYGD